MPRKCWKRKRYFLWCRMNVLKFLIDENVGRSVTDYLLQKGHDVIVGREEFPGREDLKLLDWAFSENRIIVTNDKGFGFYVYYQKLPTKGVILFRFTEELPSLKITALQTLLTKNPDKISNHFIVISESGIRIRPLTR
jgi:predicted nuclease of predicted toxin-antitoxin system